MTANRRQPDDAGQVASDETDPGALDETQPAEIAQQQPAVDELRRTLADAEERYLRLLAEFDNFRRRSTRELALASDAARRAALLPLLTVLDTLEQALAAGSSDENFYQGIVATHRMFIDALRKAGAERIETVGVPFDPTVHEAVDTVSADEAAPGMVVSERRSGWRLGDGLVRPAQVVVSRPR
jgi:molecular chaperone GrpE